MAELGSVRYEETLRPAEPPVISTVEMVAPESIIHNSGREQIRIGTDFYVR